MKLKNFKKKTSSEKKEEAIIEYNLDNVFEYLKVVKVINYYTLEVIVYNNSTFNRWKFYLKGVATFDDRLTEINRDKFKEFVESMVVDKYYMFNVLDMINSTLEGTIFLEENVNKSLNTIVSNNVINCLVLKDKIKKLNRKHNMEEAMMFNKIPTKLTTNSKLHIKLNAIYEDKKETDTIDF
jgi:hypothetical protein